MLNNEIKILVVGCGSIGTRHIRNLLSLGVKVSILDVSEERLQAITSLYHLPGYSNLEEALDESPLGVVIASPSNCHYSQAVTVVKRGIPVFVEKPIAESLEEASLLEGLVDETGGIFLNGLNMRFHPSIVHVKKMLEEELLGAVYSIRAISGYYLPDWHPEADYRKSYSANKSLGGGVLLDGIHEIDYIKWFFGDPKVVFCMGGTVSNLEIDTEDMVELLMKFESGVHGEVQINYLNRTRVREFQIIGEKGIVEWDGNERMVKHFDAEEGCWKLYREPFEFHINDTYVNEMRHFINCILGKETPLNDAREGRMVMDIVESAKISMAADKVVLLSKRT